MLPCCAAVSAADRAPTVMNSGSTASLSELCPTAKQCQTMYEDVYHNVETEVYLGS